MDGGQGKKLSRTRVGRGKRSPGTTVRKVRQRGTRRQRHAKVQRVQSRRETVVGKSYAPGKPAGSTLAREVQSDAARSENLTDHACSSSCNRAPGGDCGNPQLTTKVIGSTLANELQGVAARTVPLTSLACPSSCNRARRGDRGCATVCNRALPRAIEHLAETGRALQYAIEHFMEKVTQRADWNNRA